MHWAAQYIGLPYQPQGEGPDSFHCWSFFRFVQARQFGRDLPIVPNPESLIDQERMFRDHPEHARWDRVDVPVEGDAVTLRKGRYPIHIGLWLDVDGGRVLHCVEDKGVVCQGMAGLKVAQWEIEGFYAFKG